MFHIVSVTLICGKWVERTVGTVKDVKQGRARIDALNNETLDESRAIVCYALKPVRQVKPVGTPRRG